MISRILQLILSVVIYLCSTPAGMAREAIREEVRADFFVASEMGEEPERRTVLSMDGAALLPGAEIVIESEDSVQGVKQVKRNVRRVSSSLRFVSKLHFFSAFSPKAWAKGVARHPRTQDARQERTQTIRFLQLSALAC